MAIQFAAAALPALMYETDAQKRRACSHSCARPLVTSPAGLGRGGRPNSGLPRNISGPRGAAQVDSFAVTPANKRLLQHIRSIREKIFTEIREFEEFGVGTCFPRTSTP
jgi:hypothetical protein